jgi:hypothetical protein
VVRAGTAEANCSTRPTMRRQIESCMVTVVADLIALRGGEKRVGGVETYTPMFLLLLPRTPPDPRSRHITLDIGCRGISITKSCLYQDPQLNFVPGFRMPMIHGHLLVVVWGVGLFYPVYSFGKVTAEVNPGMNIVAMDRCFLVQVRASGELNDLIFIVCSGLRGSSVLLGSKGASRRWPRMRLSHN